MRISLIETEYIEKYIGQQGDYGERLLFEARMQLDSELAERVVFQEKAYHLIREYGLHKIKSEISRVDEKIFSDSVYGDFKKRVLSYFNH